MSVPAAFRAFTVTLQLPKARSLTVTEPPEVVWEKVAPLGPVPLTVKLAAFMSIGGRRVLALMLLVSWMEREPPLELEEPMGLGQEVRSTTINTASQRSTRRLVFIRFPPKSHFGEFTESGWESSRRRK